MRFSCEDLGAEIGSECSARKQNRTLSRSTYFKQTQMPLLLPARAPRLRAFHLPGSRPGQARPEPACVCDVFRHHVPSLLTARAPARPVDLRHLQDFSGLQVHHETTPGITEVSVPRRPESTKPPGAKPAFGGGGDLPHRGSRKAKRAGEVESYLPKPARWALRTWTEWPSQKSPAILIGYVHGHRLAIYHSLESLELQPKGTGRSDT